MVNFTSQPILHRSAQNIYQNDQCQKMLSIHRIRMLITPKLSVPDGGKMAATLARFRRQPSRRCLGAKRTTSVARVDISRTIARRDFKTSGCQLATSGRLLSINKISQT